MTRRWGRGALLATVPAALLICLPWQLTRFWPPKLVLAFLGVAGGLVLLARVRTAPGASERLGPGITGAWWLVCAWGALSLTWSADPSQGIVHWLLWLLAGLWAVALGCGFNDLDTDRRRLWLRLLAWAWLGAAVAVAALALAQRAGLARLGLHRVTATVGNPNRVAVVLVLSLPLAALLAGCERRPTARWLARVAGGVVVAGVLATGCQAGVVALVSLLAVLWLTSARPVRLRWGVAALLMALAALWASARPLPADAGHSLRGRLYIARVSARVVAERPVRGVGLGGYSAHAMPAQAGLLADRPDQRHRWSLLADAHNPVAMAWTELGVVGLLALLVFLGGGMRRLWLSRATDWGRCGLAAWVGLAVCSVTEATLQSPAVILLAVGWLVLGSPAARRREAIGPLPRAGARAVPALAVGGLVLALGVLGAHWQLGQALRRLSRSGSGSRAAAARHLDRGLALWGASAELRYARARLRAAQGSWHGAEQDLRASYGQRVTPDRALLLGDLRLARRDPWGAVRWYRRAVWLHPRYQRGYNNLGVALLRAGQRAAACGSFRRARSLRPADPVSRENVKLYCGRRPVAQRDQ